jgi:hypothetical protein
MDGGSMRGVKSILFNAPMIQALLDGRKTQTRRVAKGLALDWLDGAGFDPEFVADPDNQMCPYGKPGDLLWVRENLDLKALVTEGAQECDIATLYAATPEAPCHLWRGSVARTRVPSIHMPRWASRLTLEITNIHVERLQDITEEDAESEGVFIPICVGLPPAPCRGLFQQLWESIKGKDSWDANPWVWVISFQVHKMNVDDFLKMEGVQ